MVLKMDTSEILDWGLNSDSDAGAALRQMMADREKGLLIPDWVIFAIIKEWFEIALYENPEVKLFLWSGFPRTVAQSALTKEIERYRMLNIALPPEVAMERYLERWRRTPAHKRRPDDPPTLEKARQLISHRHGVYLSHVGPILHDQAERTIDVDGTEPLELRLHGLLQQLLPLKDEFIRIELLDAACDRFADLKHKVHMRICEIEHPAPERREADVSEKASVFPFQSAGHAVTA